MTSGRVRFGNAVLAILAALACGAPVHAQSAFFREVVLKPRATQADGVRMVSILLGKRVGDLSSDTEFLKTRGVMPQDWKPSADAQLSKGWASYLLIKALGERGGAGARVMGWSKRRAYQELVHLQVMPAKGGEHAKLTGPEVITLLDRSAAHRAKRQSRLSEQVSQDTGGKPEGKGK
ncbi:MAG: hypothetical protein HY816_15285 [Candidatus Wallbacteria bacterium]|nr:hypothetical protein [Candidatus Wallbacteria bacterium]